MRYLIAEEELDKVIKKTIIIASMKSCQNQIEDYQLMMKDLEERLNALENDECTLVNKVGYR